MFYKSWKECPDDETITCYVECCMPDKTEQHQFKQHLKKCIYCNALVKACKASKVLLKKGGYCE